MEPVANLVHDFIPLFLLPTRPPTSISKTTTSSSMMLNARSFLTGSLVALLVTQVATVDQTVNPHLDDETKLAPTNYDKITKFFPNDTDWIYDFTTNKFYNFAPGGVSN